MRQRVNEHFLLDGSKLLTVPINRNRGVNMQDSGLDVFVRQQVPTILHPKTHEPLMEWVMKNGRVIRPIMGASPDDPDDDGDDEDDADDGDDKDKSGDSGADKDGNDDDSSGDDDKPDKDMDALKRRMKAADKRANAAEKELQKRKDAEKDDLTRVTDQVTELEGQLKEAKTSLSELRLQNSFLTANKHTWHDPDTALSLAQSKGFLEGVIDEDDGSVDKSALTKALDKLAKEHSYLVKSKKDADEDDDVDEPSGSSAGGRSGNQQDDAAKKQQLKRRFPVLNR